MFYFKVNFLFSSSLIFDNDFQNDVHLFERNWSRNWLKCPQGDFGKLKFDKI